MHLITIVVYLLFSLTVCKAQSNFNVFKKLEINGVTFNKIVNAIYEDSSGFLWIGCNSGLYRYDGNELVTYQYNVFDPNSIPNNTINSIIEDNFNNLWIGSDSYLILYNRSENKFYNYYKNSLTTLLGKDSEGHIWALLSNIGLLKIVADPNGQKPIFDNCLDYSKATNLQGENIQISSFVQDIYKRYWIGTTSGLKNFKNKGGVESTTFKFPIRSLKLIKGNRIMALCDNGLFILRYYENSTDLEILENYTNFVGTNTSLRTIAIDSIKDELWLGSTKGLYKGVRKQNRYIFENFSNNSQETSLLNNQISSTVFDAYGNLWIGTLRGINKYVSRAPIFEFNKINPTNTDRSIADCLFLKDKNTLLITRPDGLYKYNLHKKTYHKIKSDLANIDFITHSLHKDKLLITDDKILYEAEIINSPDSRLKLKEIARFNNLITDIAIVDDHEIWVGLWTQGLEILDTKESLSHFKMTAISRLIKSHVSTLLLSKNLDLWVGTRGKGLFKVDLINEKIEEFLPQKDNGISSNAILSLHEDQEQNIWIGTRGGGLNKYDYKTKTFKVYKNINGLSSNVISAIEEDKNENLWLYTEEGITFFDVDEKRFTAFGQQDGIEEATYKFNVSTASKTRDTLFFGSIDGFYSVYPSMFFQEDKIPSTVITRFQTLGELENNISNTENTGTTIDINFSSDKKIELPYNKNNIVVNFSSLDLTSPSKNKYAYMLEGLNEYWVYTDASNRNANYNDLPPGDYVFKVKSSNSDGIWNENPTEIKFAIMPPIWESVWAIRIYFLLFFLLVFIGVLMAKRWLLLKKNLVKETISREKDKEHHQMRMTFFTDISHELRTPLALILGTIERVIKSKDFQLNAVSSQRIYNNTRRMNRLINQIMDLRKFDEGKLKLNISKNDIIKDIAIIKNAFNDFANSSEIHYEFHTTLNHLKGWYDVDILEKILFNLLSNAFKYTPEKGKISLTTKLIENNASITEISHLHHGKYVKCTVEDNGIGIPENDLPFIFDRFYQSTKTYKNQIPGTGIGMELVQKLVERHHGLINVDSVEKKFTRFTFYLPINKERFDHSEIIEKGTPLKRNFIKNSEFQVINISENKEDTIVNFNKKIGKPKVLLVEDNNELRQMMRDHLEDEFNVIEAPNGSRGFDMAINEKPKLIISDILMPIEDGISMLKRIKFEDSLSSIPIFMLTAKNTEDDKVKCLQLGADDYIEKPFSLEFVKWKVKNTLLTREELKEKYSKVITASPTDVQVSSNDDKFISKLISIIDEYMDDSLLSVEFLASEVGMSRTHLYRKIRDILNDTPVNFIKKTRLKRAAQLLKKNTMYKSEIAYMTGFNNQKYFGKCFTKEFGMSPTEYIKKHATDKDATIVKN